MSDARRRGRLGAAHSRFGQEPPFEASRSSDRDRPCESCRVRDVLTFFGMPGGLRFRRSARRRNCSQVRLPSAAGHDYSGMGHFAGREDFRRPSDARRSRISGGYNS